ncbi:MAG: hypothetical protein DRO87_07920 [Candidatus Thorarchaeota archaeon]|nr:MAG: hypothetical protein DRP09_10720 [Candidatus Thorarchaeota archaeon]RLI56499.1 MAG: hypothetical protein DRO87_07920 [Candidatus Thorarchaeota archaeon]
MKEFALYTGCTTPVRLPSYEASVKAVLSRLGITLVDMSDANCCGAQYIESVSHKAFVAMSARILALAEKMGLDLLTVCGACSGSIKTVKHELDHDKKLRDEINALLAEEGLTYTGKYEVKHLLQVFAEDIGYEAIREAIVRPYKGVRLSAHYGCHVTRPEEIVQVDDAENPTIIDKIIEIAGGTAVDYVGKTRCCGGPMLGVDPILASRIGRDKIENIRAENVQGIVTVCEFCNLQLTQVQFGDEVEGLDKIPVITLPQFLGPALGIDFDSLGISMNRISPQPVLQG